MKKLLLTATLLLTLSSSAIAANTYTPELTVQETQTETAQAQTEQIIQDGQFYYISATVTKSEYDNEQEQYLTTLVTEDGNEFIIYADEDITGNKLYCTVDSCYTEDVEDDEIVNCEFVEE